MGLLAAWSQGQVRRRTIIYCTTVSFHNFKSQNLKLNVSNPKSIYVAYLSVLSQISNYQGLGRKNKHELLCTIYNTIYIYIYIHVYIYIYIYTILLLIVARCCC